MILKSPNGNCSRPGGGAPRERQIQPDDLSTGARVLEGKDKSGAVTEALSRGTWCPPLFGNAPSFLPRPTPTHKVSLELPKVFVLV